MLAARSPAGENGRLSSIDPGFGVPRASPVVAITSSGAELPSTVIHASLARVSSGGALCSEQAAAAHASAKSRTGLGAPREVVARAATIQWEQGMLGA